MNKVKERAEQNTITVRDKVNGSKEARITIKLGTDKGNRIAKCAKTTDLAVYKLLEEIESYIDIMIQNRLITCKINTIISQKLMKSINELQITSSEITEKVLLIVNKINNFNNEFDNGIIIQHEIIPSKDSTVDTNNISKMESKKLDLLDDIALEWKRYELELCKKTDENPRPLSQKTIDGYCYTLDNNIIPFLKKCKIMYLQQITEDVIKELLKTTNGYHQKRLSYIVLTLLFRYFKKNKRINENPMDAIDKPKQPFKTKDNTISCIDPNRIDIWIEKFEEENTDMSLLWETMLCLGLRPEEACRFKMDCNRHQNKGNNNK